MRFQLNNRVSKLCFQVNYYRKFGLCPRQNKNSELINVNESGTAEDFANLIKNPYFRSLENDYVKLVKKLEKIEGVEQEVDLNALPTDERNGVLLFLIGR